MKIIILITCFALTLAANAGVFKWTDENGNVHFGDRPANRQEATELIYDTESRAGITNSSGNTKERDRMTRELESDRKERESKREEQEVVQKKRNKRCVKATKELRWYERANSIYTRAKNGVRTYLTDEERDAKMKKIQRTIKKNCR